MCIRDSIFGRCADLAADQIGTIVESDQLAGKQGHQPLLQDIVLRVNHHAIGKDVYKRQSWASAAGMP